MPQDILSCLSQENLFNLIQDDYNFLHEDYSQESIVRKARSTYPSLILSQTHQVLLPQLAHYGDPSIRAERFVIDFCLYYLSSSQQAINSEICLKEIQENLYQIEVYDIVNSATRFDLHQPNYKVIIICLFFFVVINFGLWACAYWKHQSFLSRLSTA